MQVTISNQNALKLGNALRDSMEAYFAVPANQEAYLAWLKKQTDEDCKKELVRLLSPLVESENLEVAL